MHRSERGKMTISRGISTHSERLVQPTQEVPRDKNSYRCNSNCRCQVCNVHGSSLPTCKLVRQLYLGKQMWTQPPMLATNDDKRKWFVHQAKMLQQQADGAEALRALLGRRFQRGHNYHDSTNKDKSKVRRKQEECKKKATDFKSQAQYAKQAGILYGAEENEFAGAGAVGQHHEPVELKLECVEALEMMRRCKEELDTTLPRERTSYIRVCREQHHQLCANAKTLEDCAKRNECSAAARSLLLANGSVLRQGSTARKRLATLCEAVVFCTSVGLTLPL